MTSSKNHAINMRKSAEAIEKMVSARMMKKYNEEAKYISKKCAIDMRICPNCAGDLRSISGFFYQLFKQQERLLCGNCGSEHIMEFGCGANSYGY